MNIPKIGQTLLTKRRELGLTQEEVATYFGVSKASVSKWETGQSFPDTLLIPQLATFFNISIDELFGYTPELSTNTIKAMYEDYGQRFINGDDQNLWSEIEESIKEYYAYPQFILSMSQWFINYATIEKETTKKTKMIDRSYTLARHALEISNNSTYFNSAEMLCVMILFYQQKYKDCFEILGEEAKIMSDAITNNLLANIYTSLGKKDKASQINQVNIFQNAGNLLDSLTNHQSCNIENDILHDTIYQQIKTLISSFELEKTMINSVFLTHLIAAQSSIIHQKYHEAISRLNIYYDLISNWKYPVPTNENDYFNLVNDWVEENSFIGRITPMTQNQTKQNLCNAILDNPIFDTLKEYPAFQELQQKLEAYKHG